METLAVKPLDGKVILRRVFHTNPRNSILGAQEWDGTCEVGTPSGEFQVGDLVLISKRASGFQDFSHDGDMLLVGDPKNILARV
jgi:hypothetical protein